MTELYNLKQDKVPVENTYQTLTTIYIATHAVNKRLVPMSESVAIVAILKRCKGGNLIDTKAFSLRRNHVELATQLSFTALTVVAWSFIIDLASELRKIDTLSTIHFE